jgi:hypothetical protein
MTELAPNPTPAKRGRPRGSPAKVKPMQIDDNVHGVHSEAAPARMTRQPTRENTREMPREVSRPGAAVVRGREGEVLTRRRTSVSDPYEVQHLAPAGWRYQWNTFVVLGQLQHNLVQTMAENGWRAVPIERHPGVFGPLGAKGDIIRDESRLEERPVELDNEAKAEDIQRARDQVRNQNEALKLQVAQKVPTAAGFSGENPRASRGASMSIDDGHDIPVPKMPREA